MPDLDETFLALPLDALSNAALDRATALGASFADVRVERIRNQSLVLRDAQLEHAADDVELGIGCRVVIDGSVGFAASADLSPETAAALVDEAIEAARATAAARGRPVELVDEPAHGDVTWVSPHEIDPTTVPLAEKLDRLVTWSRGLLEADGVDHVTAYLLAVAEDKHYASTAGTRATQRRVRVHPSLEALSVGKDGSFDTMRTCAPPAGRGYEYLNGVGWDFESELAQIPELLLEKLGAPSVRPGRYDLVIDPTNLFLTIHESVGHATELDRALGYEAAYAGTTFATLDKLGTLRYGSDLMHVTGDRTAEHGLATCAIDDDGVATQAFDLVRDGTLVGYQLDRTIAAEVGWDSSNGCAFACSPFFVPIQRMANVSLAHAGPSGPSTAELISGVEDGIYIVGDKSWSIDMQRYNFQFTGQRFYRIEHGEITGAVRDVAYQATTTDFWGSLVRLGGESTYLLGGAFNCGKGQPGQVAPVSHGTPSAHFQQINVLNAREEAGR
jgi:TldD protein